MLPLSSFYSRLCGNLCKKWFIDCLVCGTDAVWPLGSIRSTLTPFLEVSRFRKRSVSFLSTASNISSSSLVHCTCYTMYITHVPLSCYSDPTFKREVSYMILICYSLNWGLQDLIVYWLVALCYMIRCHRCGVTCCALKIFGNILFERFLHNILYVSVNF